MSDICLRPAARADLPRLHELNQAAVPAVGDVTAQALWQLVEQAVCAPVVERAGEVVGFLVALGPGLDYASPNYRFFAERYHSFAYVDRVVVAPEAVRRGLGRRLYEAVIEAQRAVADLVACEVNVRPRNDESLAFHAALGFTAVGEQEAYGGTVRVRMLTLPLSAG